MFIWRILSNMNAIIYTRVSSKSQNVKRQLIELQEKCNLKEWKVTNKISDIISGAVPYSNRKGFKEIMSLIQRRELIFLLFMRFLV